MNSTAIAALALLATLAGCVHLWLAETTIERIEAYGTFGAAALLLVVALCCREKRP